MCFAERQLRRHGWRRGQGLGKREDGIAQSIRVKVKCDTAGVGHHAGEPFSFHWWDHVFNKAAANIAVEAGQDGISVKTLSQQGLSITSKKPRKASSADTMLYGRFVKSAMLTAHGEESTKLHASFESSEEEEEKLDLSSAKRLTDEELMRACGGRTAHKGARHGLTMSAKLARLEEQERAFLATYQCREWQKRPLENSPPAGGQEKRKKKKRKRSRDGADPEVLQSQEPTEEVLGEEDKITERKKKKKKENQEPSRGEEVVGEAEKVVKRKKNWENQVPIEKEEVVKKRKKKKNQEPSREEEVSGEEGKAAKRKKKKQEEEEENKQPVQTEEKKKRKKDKKKEYNEKAPSQTEAPLEDTDGPDQTEQSPRKKRKKKKRELE